MESESVIGAFSEEHASAISGLSVFQLQSWCKEGLIKPSFATDQKGIPYGRLYSFRDLVSLQILNDLRNNKKIPLSHLREVAEKLSHLGDRKWIGLTLYVLGKRVVFNNPRTAQREEIVSGQRVFDIPLRVVARSTRDKIAELNDRSQKLGSAEQKRFVSGNRRVFKGTRVPVQGVIDFLKAGYSADQIIREFPDLTIEDISFAEGEIRDQAA